MAWFRRYGLAEKSLFGLPKVPVAGRSPGGPKAHFWAEKLAWRPLEAVLLNETKLRAVRAEPVAKFLDRFGPPGPP